MDFHNTWYATAKRAQSRSKILVFDHLGTLTVANSLLSFNSCGFHIGPNKIASIDFTRQRSNLIAYAITSLLIFPAYLWIGHLVHRVFDVPAVLTVLVCYSTIPFGLVVGYSTKWIRVALVSEDGQIHQAYFADRGWRGIFGGTRRLYERMLALCPDVPTD